MRSFEYEAVVGGFSKLSSERTIEPKFEPTVEPKVLGIVGLGGLKVWNYIQHKHKCCSTGFSR